MTKGNHKSESNTLKATRVQEMFDRISNRYDLMNRLMTWGQDQKWRRYVVGQTQLPGDGRLLDIGAGTGAIAMEAKSRMGSGQIVASDFSVAMMRAGRKRPAGKMISWVASDALDLPFMDQTFDAVTSGYLARNTTDVLRAFSEQTRVVKSGGRVVCLETSPLPGNVLRPFIQFYFRFVIPFMGKIISGDRDAYTYLPDTTQRFLSPTELAEVMQEAGLTGITYKKFMFGTMAVHTGIKP